MKGKSCGVGAQPIISGFLLRRHRACISAMSNFRTGSLPLAKKPDKDRPIIFRRTSEIIGWIVGFFASIWLLGFPTAVPLNAFLYLKVGAKEPWPISMALTFLAWLSFLDYLIMPSVFHFHGGWFWIG